MANEEKKKNSGEKKQNKFVTWWLGLSKPLKGVLIGATSLGVASAVVFPTLAATGVFSKKSVEITETIWKKSISNIFCDYSNPSKDNDYEATMKTEYFGGMEADFFIKGYKFFETPKTTSNDSEPTFYQFRESDKKLYKWVRGSSTQWVEPQNPGEAILFIAMEMSGLKSSLNMFSSFTKNGNDYSCDNVPVLPEYNNAGTNAKVKITFNNDGNITNLITSAVAPENGQEVVLCNMQISKHGKASLPNDYPTDPLPQA